MTFWLEKKLFKKLLKNYLLSHFNCSQQFQQANTRALQQKKKLNKKAITWSDHKFGLVHTLPT